MNIQFLGGTSHFLVLSDTVLGLIVLESITNRMSLTKLVGVFIRDDARS